MSNPIIKYTSRSYTTVMNDIDSNSELRDKPSWWKKIWAGVMDVVSMIINAISNDSYLETAFTEESVDRLLALIDYTRSPRSTSSGNILFYLSRSVVFPITVLKADLIAYSEGSSSVASKRFEASADETFIQVLDNFTADAGTDKLTVTVDFPTGSLVRLLTTGTLPGGLSTDTDYYLIRSNATEVYVATSLEDAYNGIYINITDAGSGTHTINLFSKEVEVSQMESKSNQIVGTSDGITEWQEFDMPDQNILRDTIEITINSDIWTRVDSFVYSILTDKHFKVIYKTDGNCKIMFGNGVYGAIPGAFDIYSDYAIGGGVDSNITSYDKINSYGGGDGNISGVSNNNYLTGGGDRESIASAKIVGPILLKTRDRFVTVADGEALVLGYGGVARVKINKNVYGLLSCQVVIVPNGGGTPSSGLKSAIDTYLTDRSILESIDIRVVDPTYITTNVTIDVKVLEDYTFANIEDYLNLACYLFISEKTAEIQTLYNDTGIDDAVDYINTTWSFSFTDADYTQIIELIESVTPIDFGDTLQESKLFGLISEHVYGVDYLTVSAPTFPVSLNTDEITHEGSITVGEIT